MKRWKNTLTGCSLAAAIAASGIAQASLVSVTTTAATVATGSWPAGPKYVSINGSGLSYSLASTGQGSTIQGGASTDVLSETFTPGSSGTFGAPNSTGFNLGKIDILAGGGNVNNNVSIHLYALSLSPSAVASASYNDGSHNMGPDLLNGGAGYSFAWNPGVPPGSNNTWLTEFTFDGADNIALASGTTYALEFWSTGGTNFVWNRGSGSDPGGQMFGAHNSNISDTTLAGGERATIDQEGYAGGAPRTASLALYAAVVPEPTSIGLLAIASIGLLGRRRNKIA